MSTRSFRGPCPEPTGMIAVNRTRGIVLSRGVGRAETFLARFKGLLLTGTPSALWIAPCAAVHTFGMRYPIDVLFLDAAGTVVGICEGLRPCRVSPRYPAASGALELPAGTVGSTGTRPGDRVALGAEE